MTNNYKTIGILGGMGPEAGADLYMRIIKRLQQNEAQDDNDFPQIFLNSINPAMPWQQGSKH